MEKSHEAIERLSDLLKHVVSVNDRQSKLLASRDVQAYQGIIAMDQFSESNVTEKQLSDDEIAFQEAQERGMTEDDLIYFRSIGLIEPDAEKAD